jgi:hypothetical protein
MFTSLSQEGIFQRLRDSSDPAEQKLLLADLRSRRLTAAEVKSDISWQQGLLARWELAATKADNQAAASVAEPPSPAADTALGFRAWCREEVQGIFENWLQLGDYSQTTLLGNARILVNELDARRKHCGFEALSDVDFFCLACEAIRDFLRRLESMNEDTVNMSNDETRTRIRRDLDGTASPGTLAHALQNLDRLEADRQKWDQLREANQRDYALQLLMIYAGRIPAEAGNLLQAGMDAIDASERSRHRIGLYDYA